MDSKGPFKFMANIFVHCPFGVGGGGGWMVLGTLSNDASTKPPVDLLKPVSNLLEVIQHGVGGHLSVIHLSSERIQIFSVGNGMGWDKLAGTGVAWLANLFPSSSSYCTLNRYCQMSSNNPRQLLSLSSFGRR